MRAPERIFRGLVDRLLNSVAGECLIQAEAWQDSDLHNARPDDLDANLVARREAGGLANVARQF
ncbi:MAG: hypothetical protein M3O34_11515 [Chloroflexota bacterium]|nr:hypothetical protein [Chloroflexota bacterium]